jgi:hypothetical protein
MENLIKFRDFRRQYLAKATGTASGRHQTWTTAFSILVITESMLQSGFFLKKMPPSMES